MFRIAKTEVLAGFSRTQASLTSRQPTRRRRGIHITC
jgi:hypothetical protein